jgi:vacuolar-type H+-ATPase subunit I/STV1
VKQSVTCVSIIFALVLAFFGCAKPPTEEMNQAVAAVTAAENDADALTYAASSLVRARETLIRMQEAADSKRYDEAKTLASEAVAAAQKAIADGKTGAERAKAEAESLVEEVKAAALGTEEALRNAKTVKNIKLDFTALDRDLAGARRTLDQAEISLAGSNYQDASEKGRSARAALSDITNRIAGAATAVSRKK